MGSGVASADHRDPRVCSRLELQRHEVQPDVYCRRLGLQVPVAVSVKTGQMADVFHAICSIAISPYVFEPDWDFFACFFTCSHGFHIQRAVQIDDFGISGTCCRTVGVGVMSCGMCLLYFLCDEETRRFLATLIGH